ncbi:MAG: flippase-like domain-containing protein [Acidimicrobiia bacterium]|nr:flippase-like domain-containing protein [Acidimicrobiia bacterium]
MTEPQTPGEEFTPPAPPQRTSKDRRNSLIALGVGLIVVIFIFGFLLPQVIDYETVFTILKELDPADYVVMIGAGLILYLPEGALYASLMPGMGLRRGISAWVASTAVSTTIPGADLVVRYGMYRSWGFGLERTMLGIVLSGLFDNIVKFSLPSIAVILFLVLGVGDLGDFVWIAIIALAVLIVMAIVVIGMVRSEKFTQWLAEKAESIANWGLGKIKRDPVEGLSDRVVGFRDLAIGIVSESGVKALIFSATGKLWAFVMLTLALRIVGLGPDILSLGQIFIVWVIVLMITAIPITPGGIGIAEMAYIYFFSQMIGDQYADLIAAGVILFRLAQWFMPIPIGWVSVGLWRRQITKGDLPDPFTMAPTGDSEESD